MIPESLPPDAYARDSDSSINNKPTPVVTPDRIPPPIKESPTEKKIILDHRLKKTESTLSQNKVKNQQNSTTPSGSRLLMRCGYGYRTKTEMKWRGKK